MAKKKPARKATKPAQKPKLATAAGVMVVNMIPKTLSGEINQDSEPMIAVNPNNPKHIVGTAFTPDPMGGSLAPIYVSNDGGQTWTLNSIVPGGQMTSDITVAFSGTSEKLYAGILRQDSPIPKITRMSILRTNDFSSPSIMEVLDDRQKPDQPFTQAATVAGGTDAGQERVYVGNNDFAGAPHTATLDISTDAGSDAPTFKSIRLEKRSTATAGQDGPQIRPTIHADGTVYAAFYGWRSQSGSWQANTLKVTADVVVARDDNWGAGTTSFEALKDAQDGLAGIRVAKGVTFAFDRQGKSANGQQRLGGSLSIAVDPRPGQSGIVYLAWGDDQTSTGFTLHVRRSLTGGPPGLRTC